MLLLESYWFPSFASEPVSKQNKRCCRWRAAQQLCCFDYLLPITALLCISPAVSTWQPPCEGLCRSGSRTPSDIKAVPKHCSCQPPSSAPYAAKHECENPKCPAARFCTPPASVLITLVFKGYGTRAARWNLWKAWCSKTNVERVEWVRENEGCGVKESGDGGVYRYIPEESNSGGGSSFGLEPPPRHANLAPLPLPLAMHIKCMTCSEEEF